MHNDSAAAFGRRLAIGTVAHTVTLEANVMRGPINAFPVRLEGTFVPLDPLQTFQRVNLSRSQLVNEEIDWVVGEWVLPSLDDMDLRRAEGALAALAGCVGPLCFEVHCRGSHAKFFVGAAREEWSFVRAAWLASYPESALVPSDDPSIALNETFPVLYDFFSPAPYHRAIRTKQTITPWRQFLRLCGSLTDDEVVCCQVLFAPTRQPWQQNIVAMLEAERSLGRHSPIGATTTAKDTTEPLFAAAIRLVSNRLDLAPDLEAFTGHYTVDGQPFKVRTIDDFRDVLSDDAIAAMLPRRLTYTTGQLFSSSELATIVHAPDRSAAESLRLHFREGLIVPHRLRRPGLPLGVNHNSGIPIAVFQPELAQHNRNVWMLGSSRMGKSSMIIHRLRYFAEHRRGVGLIDPHRTTAFAAVDALGGVDPDRVVFLDFDAPDAVAYNPFVHVDEREYGRLTSDFVYSLRHLFDAAGFHRMAHFLGNAVYGLFVLGANLATLPDLFARSAVGKELRQRIVAGAKNEAVKRFWRDEYYTHSPAAFSPIMNRLSALLLDDRTQRTFTQTENRVDLATAMDEGKIIIVAPPASIDAASIVGGMIIAQLKHAALRRAGTIRSQQHFHVIVDEFHRFVSSAQSLQSIIDETAKGGLSVCLANQETGQLPDELLKALYSIPNTFVFGVNLLDARQLAHLFNAKVSAEVLAAQTTGQVYARIGPDTTNFQAHPPFVPTNASAAAAIIAYSREHYYTQQPSVTLPDGWHQPRTIDTFSED